MYVLSRGQSVRHSYSKFDVLQQISQDERHHDGADRAAGSHEAVRETDVFLEVVAEDGEGWGVGKGSTGSEEDAVGQIKWNDLGDDIEFPIKE